VEFGYASEHAGRFSPGYEQVCGWADGVWAGRPGKAGPP